jgi:hypothetical protein
MMATADRTPDGAAETSVEDWRVGISGLVGDLRRLVLMMIDHQSDTRIYRLGFLTYAGRTALDRQTVEERRVRAENAQQGHPAPSADISPPGDFRVVAADADLTTTLRHTARRLLKHHKANDRAPVPALAGEPTPSMQQLLDYVLELTAEATDDKLLAGIYRDLNTAREESERAVDGVGRDHLPDPCPFCGHQTLVVDFRQDLIQCDRDPKTGLVSPCVCPDPICECKSKPVAFRHTWYRNPLDQRRKTPSDTWHKLAGRLKFSRNTISPTK